MGIRGTRLKFRMELHSHKKRMVRQLYGLCQPVVRRDAAYHKSRLLHLPAVLIVKLIAVAVALMDQSGANGSDPVETVTGFITIEHANAFARRSPHASQAGCARKCAARTAGHFDERSPAASNRPARNANKPIATIATRATISTMRAILYCVSAVITAPCSPASWA